jgi:beta-1,4-mannosyl-glycoprotein beta-1,4-N-acetylglucosaminyltransferase
MRRLPRTFLVVALFLFLVFSIFGIRNPYKLKTTFSYITRPVWDKMEYPNAPIINLASPELLQSHSPEDICRLHNNSRPREQSPQLWDAMIFSHELDMLEVHMTELDSVVDRFVIMESDFTYSGQPKPLYFKENRNRFAKWDHKISYMPFLGTKTEDFSFKPGDFALETQQRNAMTQFLWSLRIPAGTLLLVADVDEIPYAETMELIKLCQFPAILHLELNPFVYSFEFASGDIGSWHIQVHSWLPDASYYKHSSKSTEDYITEAGVHCR